MPNVFRGMAQVAGTKFAADVILYPIAESLELSHEFDEDIIQNEAGDDAAWKSRNEKYMGDLGMYLVDKTAPSGSTAAHAKAGAAFLAPYALLIVTTCEVAAWNATWQLIPGAKISQKNTDTGKMSYKLRRYVDTTQNTLATTIPG